MKREIETLVPLIAAILWGFSGTCGQYIFDNFGADPTYLTAVRLLVSGIILIIIGFLFDKKNMIAIWKSKASVIQLTIFAILGLMFCQLSYMKAIAYSNSGTATILQYTGPVMVMIVSCFMAHKLPSGKEVIAIIMALIGTFVIATHGDISNMVITPKGLIWGILSAVALMLYTLLPGKIIHAFGSITVTGYGMLIGGIILCVQSKVWEAPIIHDWKCGLAFGAIVILGTVLSFTMYLMGVKYCGPVKTSMLASIEPVAATVFMVVWLKSPFALMDLVGFGCIFVTIFLLTKKESSV